MERSQREWEVDHKWSKYEGRDGERRRGRRVRLQERVREGIGRRVEKIIYHHCRYSANNPQICSQEKLPQKALELRFRTSRYHITRAAVNCIHNWYQTLS